MLTFTGIGSAHCPQLGSCCAHFWADGDLVLLDCGEDTFASPVLRRALARCRGSVYCFVTHFHSDHVGSLATLCLYLRQVYGRRVRVCHPQASVGSLLGLMGVLPTEYELRTDFPVYLSNNWSLTPVPTVHVPWMSCYGYLISAGTQTIYYSGDAGQIPRTILNLLFSGGIDRLYQDVSLRESGGGAHLRLPALCGTISEPSMRRKICTMHFDSPDYARQIQSEHFLTVNRESAYD